MRKLKIALLLLVALIDVVIEALPVLSFDSWTHLHAGDQTADQLLQEFRSLDRSPSAELIPQYQGISPEASLREEELSSRASTQTLENEAGQFVVESAETRSRFKVDTQTDPLFVESQSILQNPLQAIGGRETKAREVAYSLEDEILTCEESGEESEHTCTSTLTVEVEEAYGPSQWGTFTVSGPWIYAHQGGLLNHWPREGHKHFVAYMTDVNSIKIFIAQHKGIPVHTISSAFAVPSGGTLKVANKRYTYENYVVSYAHTPKIKKVTESWVNRCDALEALSDKNLCSYVSRGCTQGPETRIINGLAVSKPCWQETFTYRCHTPSKNNCGPLRARGCVQIDSVCKKQKRGVCVVYTQTYECQRGTLKSIQIVGGETPFCLDGSCRDQSSDGNDEMLPSLAQLSILKELQGKAEELFLFKGEEGKCSKNTLSFKDCCGSGKGWGKSLGLASCKPEEKQLHKKRQKKLCHFIGTYCAKKVLGKCVKKKSTYCCFGNKLLRVLHEQGRPQIGLGWGTPKEPLCRGFTIEEIQHIDFSRLDLSEVYEDLVKTFNLSKQEGIKERIQEKVEALRSGQ